MKWSCSFDRQPALKMGQLSQHLRGWIITFIEFTFLTNTVENAWYTRVHVMVKTANTALVWSAQRHLQRKQNLRASLLSFPNLLKGFYSPSESPRGRLITVSRTASGWNNHSKSPRRKLRDDDHMAERKHPGHFTQLQRSPNTQKICCYETRVLWQLRVRECKETRAGASAGVKVSGVVGGWGL